MLLAVQMHHGVVQIRVEGVAHLAENLHAETIQDLQQLRHGQLHALFVGGVFRGLVQRALQIVVDGKHLRYGVGLAVAVRVRRNIDNPLCRISAFGGI